MSWLVNGVRFACEIAAVVAVVWWGWPVLGIVAGAIVILLWAAWVAPKAKRRLTDPARFVLELVIFGAATGGVRSGGPDRARARLRGGRGGIGRSFAAPTRRRRTWLRRISPWDTRSVHSMSSARATGFARSASRSASPRSASTHSCSRPATRAPNHYHDRQDELYFVHRGTAIFTFDGDEHEVGEGGLVHVESTTHRMISNRTDEDLVIFIVGGKDGYVERDGHVVSDEDLAKRVAIKEMQQ